MRKADDWIDLYMKYTDNTEPPVLYREWTAVSCIASALKRKCYLNWGLDHKIYPNLYIVLVGPAGRCRKGTAMGSGTALLRELGVKLAAKSITREALIIELEQSTETTQNDKGEYDTHASLTIQSPELTVFLGYDNKQLLMDLTDWFDCDDHWTYKTKTQSTNEISGVWVNLLGATTPQLIQGALPPDAIGGGLASRMIFVYEDKKGKTVPAPFVTQEQKRQRELLIEDLNQIHEMQGAFKMTAKTIERWTSWYMTMDKHNPDMPPTFEGYLNRRQTHLRKLSMVMSASRNNDMIINLEDFERALDLLERTEVKMARTFAGLGASKNAQILTIMHQYVSQRKRVSVKDVFVDLGGYFDDKQHFMRVLSVMQQQGFCKTEKNASGGTDIVYLTGHKLHGQYGGGNVHSNRRHKKKRQHTNGKHGSSVPGGGGSDGMDGGGAAGGTEGRA